MPGCRYKLYGTRVQARSVSLCSLWHVSRVFGIAGSFIKNDLFTIIFISLHRFFI